MGQTVLSARRWILPFHLLAERDPFGRRVTPDLELRDHDVARLAPGANGADSQDQLPRLDRGLQVAVLHLGPIVKEKLPRRRIRGFHEERLDPTLGPGAGPGAAGKQAEARDPPRRGERED